MSDNDSNSQAHSAFREARLKAMLRDVWSAFQQQPNHLLAYDEVRQQLHATGGVYRGLQQVPVAQIVGSVNRYRDFDRIFLPRQGGTEQRWTSVGRAHFDQVDLPPVKLYRLGEVYFVVDGHHRVSVARMLGQDFIDAEVHEVQVRVPLTANINPRDLEIIGEKADFLIKTRLDETRPHVDFNMTIPGGYGVLLDHIDTHRYFQSVQWNREFSTDEAAMHWCDDVYLPMVQSIENSEILKVFPRKTAGDLYVWLIEHQYYLREQFGSEVTAQQAVSSFRERFAPPLFKRIWKWISHHILRRIETPFGKLD